MNFNVIFGTQMDLLKHLSKKGTLGEKSINLMSFYNECLKRWRLRFPVGTSPTIINYLEFLENMGYIKYVGECYERIVKIKPHDNGFLSYIKDQYPAEYRPFRNL